MQGFNVFCLFALCTCFAREPSRPPIIDIPNQGTIMGKEISMIRTQRVTAYLGIPYAQPPLERLRFAPPQMDPLPSWEGVRNATEYAPACMQGNNNFNKQDLPFLRLISDLNLEVNEDCLYLNVFVPFGGHAPPEGFATIVWFHPGNFTTGSPAMWNPYTLVYRHRVIVVTFAYRLNVMGFFTSNDGEAPGNYGIMDQQAVLIWVKNNIKLFGGDANNICLMGYGTGAVSIGLHMINQQSRGLYAKAIVMSSNFLNPSSVKYPIEDKGLIEKLIANFGCYPKPTSDLMVCLRRAPADALVTLTSYIDWRPLVDHGLSNNTPFLPELPKHFFDRGDYYKVPILTGYTDMEDVLNIDGLDPANVPDEEISQEFVPALLTELIGKDFQQSSNSTTDSCVYNYDHIMDSVLFFYRPSSPISDPNSARKVIADFSTDKNIGSSTYLLASHASKDQPTYVYRFDTKPSTLSATAEFAEWISVPHLFDLIYVWGLPYWTILENQDWDIRDKRTSDIIMSFWTTFAKSSNPTDNSIYPIRWEPFTKSDPRILIIDRNFSMTDIVSFNYKSLEFWNDYYPKVVTIATQCCNVTDLGTNLPTFFNSNILIVLCIMNICAALL